MSLPSVQKYGKISGYIYSRIVHHLPAGCIAFKLLRKRDWQIHILYKKLCISFFESLSIPRQDLRGGDNNQEDLSSETFVKTIETFQSHLATFHELTPGSVNQKLLAFAILAQAISTWKMVHLLPRQNLFDMCFLTKVEILFNGSLVYWEKNTF